VEGIARVLCALDIGEPGLAAFEQALALARVHAAKLIVVYAVPRSQYWSHGTSRLSAEPAGCGGGCWSGRPS
jgi:nucleotide-binding universal stress UspA family protein